MEQFDRTRGCLYTWMRNIAKNKAIDFTRCGVSKMRNKTSENEDNIHLSCPETQKTDHIGISKIVNNLPPQHQSIVNLVYYKGYTIEEISRLFDLPLGTIKSRMRRAIGLLRNDFNYAA